jgi:hypothetical protein
MNHAVLLTVRTGCAVLGLILMATGAYFLLSTEPPAAVIGVVVWLIAAVIAHDALFAPAVNIADRLLTKGAGRLAAGAVAAARILFCVGLVLTLVVGPELYAQARRHANPTVLVGDYALRLGFVWLAIALVIAAIVTASALRTRRTTGHRRSTRA